MYFKPHTLISAALLATSTLVPHMALADTRIAQPSHLTLTILHDNDLHGHILPFAYVELGKSTAEQPSRGGAARRATLVRRLRHDIPNPTLLVDSGDTTTRGPFTTTYEGAPDIAAMNAVGYDIAAIGNNEFKLLDAHDATNAAGAQADLLQAVKRSRFPWICANATDSKGGFLEGVQPYVVREINGVRIGFIGFTAPRSASYPQTKGWTISPVVPVAKEWIPKARANCDVLIAVTHIGTDDDQVLAAQTSGIDAIVGGDSHTFLYKAIETKNLDGVRVPIVQDGEFGADLGRFDLNLDKDSAGHWHLSSYKYELMPIGPNIPEAPDVAATIAPYVKPLQEVVGHVMMVASTPKERSKQTAQILVDSMRQQLNADFAVISSADNFFDVFRHTNITRYDILAAMPFHDNVMVAKLTGTEFKELLKAQPASVISGDLANINPADVYSVAFVDYEARNVYKVTEGKLVDTERDERDVVADYLKVQQIRTPGK